MGLSDGRINISFNLKRHRVLIFRDVLRALGNPGCFRFLIDGEKKCLAIQVCDFGDEGYHIVPDFSEKENGWSYELCSTELLRLIWGLCGWDREDAYRIRGVLCHEKRAAIFNLNNAEKISGEEFDTAE